VLRKKIDTCAALVVVMSPAAGASRWVADEVNRAQAQHRPVLALLLSGEPLFGLGGAVRDTVSGGVDMPEAGFLARLRYLLDQHASRLGRAGSGPLSPASHPRMRVRVGSVPNPADCFQHRAVADRVYEALTGHGTAIVPQILSGLGGPQRAPPARW
jgi:hypothetical protein